MASQQELIAYNKTREEIAQQIGADDVIYQDLEDLKVACMDACRDVSPRVKDFEVGVFCGVYQTEVPEDYFGHLDRLRGERKKQAALAPGSSGPVNVAANPAAITPIAEEEPATNGDARRPPSVPQNDIGCAFPLTVKQ